jgi:hypothetical protein
VKDVVPTKALQRILVTVSLVSAGCGGANSSDTPSPQTKSDLVRQQIKDDTGVDLSDTSDDDIDGLGRVTCDAAESLHNQGELMPAGEESFADTAEKLLAVAPTRQFGLEVDEAIRFNRIIVDAYCPEQSLE